MEPQAWALRARGLHRPPELPPRASKAEKLEDLFCTHESWMSAAWWVGWGSWRALPGTAQTKKASAA